MSTYAEAVYRLNSCFAPNAFSGAQAHQPRGFDEWAGLYGRYLVKGCKWYVEPYVATDAADDAAASNILVGTVASIEGAYAQFNTLTGVMEYDEDKFFKVRNISRNTTMTTSAQNTWQYKNARMSGYVSMYQQHKMWRGIDFAAAGANHDWPQDYSAIAAGSPATPNAEVQLTIWAASAFQGGEDENQEILPNLYANVKLVYYVEFYDPLFPAIS